MNPDGRSEVFVVEVIKDQGRGNRPGQSSMFLDAELKWVYASLREASAAVGAWFHALIKLHHDGRVWVVSTRGGRVLANIYALPFYGVSNGQVQSSRDKELV